MLPSETRTVMRSDTDAMPVMRWGAIFGGWLVATGIASMLYVAGLAMGFSALDPNNAETVAKGIGMGAAGWLILTWAVSLLLGGMFASWFDGRSDPTMGALHGVTVWGLSVTVSGLLLAFGVAQGLQGAVMSGAPQAKMTQRAAPSNDSQGASATAPPSAQSSAAGQSANGTAGAGNATRPDAEAAKRYTAAAMWIGFLSILFGLIASGIGGWLGAGHIHRVHHLRHYETRPAAAR